MKITNAQIKYFRKNGFNSLNNENVKHVKVLPYLSIVQSVEGSYDITLGNGKTLNTGEGGFFIAPSNVQQTITHHVNKKSKKMSARWIFLDIEVNKAYSLDLLYQFPAVISDGGKKELNVLFNNLFESDNIWNNYSICYALVELLIQMAIPIQNKMNKGIQCAVAYMRENYSKNVTVKALANIANMSESNFYAVFKKQMGISPIAYLNNYRLSVAADKLSESTDAVSEISYYVGIGDPLYFSRLFKKTYGTTPKEYRLIYQRKR